MAEIMGAFAHDLDNFVAYYEKLNWDTSFRGEAYPPCIVMEQSTPPLFIVEDGQKKLVPNPTIQIIGRRRLKLLRAASCGSARRISQICATVPPRCWNCSCTVLCRSARKWRRHRDDH